MKKQILIVTFFVLAFIAGTTNVFGQLIDTPHLDAALANCPIPATLNCGTDDALHPLPGEIYTYEIEVTAGSTIHWFVTTDVNVITNTAGVTTITSSRENAGGTYVLSAGTTANGGNATYNDDANTGDILEIAWNYFDPTTTVLLVAFATGADGCTNNVEVYRIEPIFNFILDIAALEDGGTIQNPADVEECAFPVQSAVYDGTNLTMDYGDNYIFYVVSAANWVTSWLPTFTAPTSDGGSTVGEVMWAYPDEAVGASSVWNAATVPVLASHYGAGVTSIGANGECIILRVNIDHDGVNEMIAAETLTMGVDGLMYNSTTSTHDLADLDDDGTGTCVNDETDEADYIINPRPDINAIDPTPFVTKD